MKRQLHGFERTWTSQETSRPVTPTPLDDHPYRMRLPMVYLLALACWVVPLAALVFVLKGTFP
ncbi:MAG: hypothetical protein AB7R89_05975 [Dehalococcoidia bacterium]